MTSLDGLHARGKALEDEYFARVDKALLEQLHENSEREEQVANMAHATGIKDHALLTEMIEAGLTVRNILAFSFTPLVFVAWASGSVSAEERQNVIRAAIGDQIHSAPAAFNLIQHWLHDRPHRELWDLWKRFANELYSAVPQATRDSLSQHLIEQANQVANASGGVLGMGKICEAEQRLIDEIKGVFQQTA